MGKRVAFARAEQELRPLVGIAEQIADTCRQCLDACTPPVRVEHEKCNGCLQRERGTDDPQPDRLAISGQRIGYAQDNDDPGNAEQLLIH